jgi:hypothetical protein
MKSLTFVFKTYDFFQSFQEFMKSQPDAPKEEISIVHMKKHIQKFTKNLEQAIFEKNLYKVDDDYSRKVRYSVSNMKSLLVKDKDGELQYKDFSYDLVIREKFRNSRLIYTTHEFQDFMKEKLANYKPKKVTKAVVEEPEDSSDIELPAPVKDQFKLPHITQILYRAEPGSLLRVWRGKLDMMGFLNKNRESRHDKAQLVHVDFFSTQDIMNF